MRAAVRHLSLRIPPGHLAASRQRAEDALHLAAPDETRLVLLRRLDLGRLPSRAPADAWAARAAERLAERRARAIHAAQPGAAAADAVWFRSIDEARELLLLLLAAGRQPTAWFWRLAVPEWRGPSLPLWLADRLEAARTEPAAAVALARAVIAAARAGCLPAVVAALAAAMLPEIASAASAAAPRIVASARRDDARLVRTQLARLDEDVRQEIIQAIGALPARGLAAHWLARLALIAAAPELAADGAVLAALADAAVAHVHAVAAVIAGTATRDAAPTAMPHAGPERSARARNGPHRRPHHPMPRDPPSSASPLSPRVARTDSLAPARPRPPAPLPDAPGAPLAEQASRGAGVLLAIRALDRLGLGARLARDPEAAVAGFGRHLLRHIATRARVPPDDTLLALLAAPDPLPDAAALQAWRVGLDRWLRRRVRLRLADLARRRGWLHLADTTLLVRFPLDAADVRLRRLALDVDPGWVPWLGLSVRYHYRGAPLA